jgi:hypothetical protein
MKSLIITIIAAALLSATTFIPGQNHIINNSEPSAKEDTIDVFMPGAYLHDQSLEDYYYNTYEITKLEWELNQLASFYKGELFGINGFSSSRYGNLTDAEKKRISDKLNSFSVSWKYDFKSQDKDSKKSVELYAEEYFNRFIAPYVSDDKDKTANKEKLQNEIKRRLNQLFELKEIERKNRITRLEKELTDLKASVISRDQNKSEIIEQKLKKLIGVPKNLRW